MERPYHTCVINRIILSRDEFKESIESGKFVPGGQILRGAGVPRAILYNCFVTNAEAGEPAEDIASRITAWTERGCGVGVNISHWVRSKRASVIDGVRLAVMDYIKREVSPLEPSRGKIKRMCAGCQVKA